MWQVAVFALFASRVYQLWGHAHYFVGAPIQRGFQATRAGHIVFTLYDALTFVGDAALVSANPVFVSLAIGHFGAAALQTVAWSFYARRFFDVVGARSFYSDGLHRFARVGLLAYDLVGQVWSLVLLVKLLQPAPLMFAALAGTLGYVLSTANLRLSR